ncbi:major facilitator superfamily domain-containing protein [Zychaea mexicana]|uniref:major facilitator superfamily domain-containing protein n=1 Tax=Zychaea mexicana TaxID=64656 RepID=UPI0022FE85C5|nr:major facilitator superfamily domain-containing protein [Zychaea mexicana]KAI9477138.1 major facilitator superfamily domain-containing protein [Zychaea mexicana]
MAMSRSKEPTDFIEPDGKELRRLMWKIDLRIVPLVSLMYLCSFLDRINIGNAKLAGLMDDMSITNSEYHWALSIFFVGYLIFEVPSNLMLKFAGPRLWLSIILLVWGVIMASMATCRTGAGLIAARFFLGVAESGLFPGIIFYLSVWYTKRQLALRIAVFYGSSTLAGAFGGIIAYGIVQMHGIGGLSGWQWIFIIEAIPTLVLGALTYVVLPNFPENTTFLNERERAIIADQKKRDAGVAADATNFTWKQVGSTMIDWKVYAFSLIFFCGALLMYSLSMFMPSIVHGMGYTSLTAQAMSSPPYAFAFVWCLFVAWHADRQGERGFHMACSITLSIIGYTILITLRDKSPLILYIGTIFTAMGVFSISPLKTAWLSNNVVGHTRRSTAIALSTTLGNIGGAIGGQLYRADDAPRYVKGNTACLAISCCLVVLPITIKYIFYKINKKRDNMAPEKLRAICENSEDLGEKHPGFRYTL